MLKFANNQIHIKENITAEYLVHSKYIIIDNKYLATGSFNYSHSAENKNDENLLLISIQLVVEKFKNNFNRLWESYKKYELINVKDEYELI